MQRIFITLLVIIALLIGGSSFSCGREVDNFVMYDLTVTPSEVSLGEKLIIEFWVDNKGYRGVLTTMTLKIDGKEVQKRQVRAEERAATRGFFRVTANETGEHTIQIINHNGSEELNGLFKVTEP